MLDKKFKYGDMNTGSTLGASRRPPRLIEPETLTSNMGILRFLKEHSYSLYLQYDDPNDLAHTDALNKRIMLNGNYSENMLQAFLQHEMGHLMIFNVNQFVDVGPQTLRSIISKVIYTPKHVIDHGMQQLFLVDNVIQDIIIETVSGKKCVCFSYEVETKEKMGVKHLRDLESLTFIAREVCDNLLIPKEEFNARKRMPGGLGELMKATIEDLLDNIRELEEAIAKAKAGDSHQQAKNWKREREEKKLGKNIDGIKKKLDKLKGSSRPNESAIEKLERILKKLQEQLEDVQSDARKEKDAAEAAKQKQKQIDSLEEQLQAAKDLLEAIRKNQEEMKNAPAMANRTDHLGDGEDEGSLNSARTFDCGFPNPKTVARDDSTNNHNPYVSIIGGRIRKSTKKITLDPGDDMISQGKKVPEKESTYFKSNKREFEASDMIAGRRKKRATGINVLIGLDVSGSMTGTWISSYREIVDKVIDLQKHLQIENVVLFTYNEKLQEVSEDIEGLKLHGRGGNAFGYVYAEMMEKLPLMQANEIILITDCGDNLGFKLTDSATVMRNGEKVNNHISVVDTLGAPFVMNYGCSDDWEFYQFDDGMLFDKIQLDIEKLINIL